VGGTGGRRNSGQIQAFAGFRKERTLIVFGPVPSRRLGQNVGINNIPPKSCSYSCVYCQVGRTIGHSIELQEFYPLGDVVSEVSGRVEEIRDGGGYEGTAFGTSGDPEQDLLSITAVHPMREDAVDELLRRAGSGWSVVETLMQRGDLERVEYREHRYYVRRFPRVAGRDE
jgi:wyosine [tRNA(Phe)-imidazoG37] synthetase (radical SAM superfamily)